MEPRLFSSLAPHSSGLGSRGKGQIHRRSVRTPLDLCLPQPGVREDPQPRDTRSSLLVTMMWASGGPGAFSVFVVPRAP